jgi:creatinine amidohydrolase
VSGILVMRNDWFPRIALMHLYVCLALLVAPARAVAEATHSVMLEDLTWTELKAQIASGKKTIIVPIGGTEQNGPYMALGKHNARVRWFAERIAVGLTDALVAPVIAYVPEGDVNSPSGHLRFPGTITVPSDTFQKVLEYAARSFKLHGFHDIVLIGDHGGYQADNKAVADRLNREWSNTGVRVHALEDYYQVSQRTLSKTLGAMGFRESEIGTHAGLADTSLMLAVDPKFVRVDALRNGTKPGIDAGVDGDPRRSSAELGKASMESIVAHTVEAIRRRTRR